MAYMNQVKKAAIAAALKPVIPAGWKWSLKCDRYAVTLTIASAPVDLVAECNRVALLAHRGPHPFQPNSGYVQLNHYHLHHHFDGELLELFKRIAEAMDTGNWDRSDVMTDYFDVGHYVHMQLGRWNKPFEVVAAKELEAA